MKDQAKIKQGRSKVLPILLALAMFLALSSCAGMNWGTSVGMGVSFGPAGPRVVPTMNIGMYSGGRYY